MNEDERPVLVRLDKDGYLIGAGDPDCHKDLKSKRELGQIVLNGGTIKTMTIEEYRQTDWKWTWDNPNNKK